MKKIFIVCSIFAILLCQNGVQSMDAHYMAEMMECGTEMGLTHDHIKEMILNKDEKLGCVNACVLKKLGALVDGKLKEDTLMTLLEEYKNTFPDFDKAKENLKTCYDEAVSHGDLPECQLSGKFGKCMHELMED